MDAGKISWTARTLPLGRSIAVLPSSGASSRIHSRNRAEPLHRRNFALSSRRGRPEDSAGPWRDLKSKMRETVRSLNLGLEDRLDSAIGSLSGGQRQALTLLMATWLKPGCCFWMNTPRRSIPRAPTRSSA